MFSYYFQGLVFGAVVILPPDPQNAFVMNQGICRQYHIMAALPCTISGLVLIYAGILGGSALLTQSPWLLALTRGGVAFLLWYGFGVFKAAMSSNIESVSTEVLKQGRWKIIATMSVVIWLNPHVCLDTFVVLDSLGGQLDVELKRWSVLGIISAFFLWFFGLAILTAWLVPRLRTTKSQRIIDLVMGCVMQLIALQLARSDITHVQALFSQVLSGGKIEQRR